MVALGPRWGLRRVALGLFTIFLLYFELRWVCMSCPPHTLTQCQVGIYQTSFSLPMHTNPMQPKNKVSASRYQHVGISLANSWLWVKKNNTKQTEVRDICIEKVYYIILHVTLA